MLWHASGHTIDLFSASHVGFVACIVFIKFRITNRTVRALRTQHSAEMSHSARCQWTCYLQDLCARHKQALHLISCCAADVALAAASRCQRTQVNQIGNKKFRSVFRSPRVPRTPIHNGDLFQISKISLSLFFRCGKRQTFCISSVEWRVAKNMIETNHYAHGRVDHYSGQYSQDADEP